MQRKQILAAGLAALTLTWSQAGLAQQVDTNNDASVAAMLARLAEQKQAWLDAAQADTGAPIAAHVAVPAKPLRKGSKGPEIAMLCNALEARGFVRCATKQDTVDAALASRIAAAQRFYGLAADGMADSQLYNALALSAAERAARIDALITEWEGIRAKAREMGADKYLVVNVPAFEVKAVANDNLALASRAIVGRPERQTPLGMINIRAIKFNPDWTPPATVLKRDIYPNLANGGDWIRAHGLVLVDRAGKAVEWEGLSADDIRNAGYHFVQPASERAALGLLKFETDSSENIYLHDTNERNLFARATRARSSGCIRVERWRELAAWMNGTEVGSIDRKVSTRKTFFEATPKVPVFIIYQLADVNDGRVVFYPDIYQRSPENSNKKALVAQR
ncbi:MAG: murein L,D-transpeptidase [Betaproteobacteria bacterium]|nr:murein L,D-transpeptidase [Betaproteobacteria bacterium]